MAETHVLSTDHAYAIMVSRRTTPVLPFRWSIVNAETRDVVQESSIGYRSMEVAFEAAGPALREWEAKRIPPRR